MAVYERTPGDRRARGLGAQAGEISRLFLLEGVLMGVLGSLFGVALGLAFNATVGHVGSTLGNLPT
jgi:ABC-type lipoprotein release transport system permease subunit